MNSPLEDETQITRYLLGECGEHEEAAIRDALEQDHVAAAEARKVEMAIHALREGAVVPDLRLSVQQRRSILTATAPRKRLLTAAEARPLPARRKRSVWLDTTYAVARIAAVIAVAVGAFLLGQRQGPELPHGVASQAIESKPQTPQVGAAQAPIPATTPVQPANPAAAKNVATVPEPAASVTQPHKADPAIAEAATSVSQSTTPTKAAPQLNSEPDAKIGPVLRSYTIAPAGDGFANASRDPESRFILQPAKIRPAPPKSKEAAFAKPLEPNRDSKAEAPTRKPAKPPFFVHSWKSEVAECPWNSGHRLMRIVIQLPANQQATADKEYTYPLQVEFDAHHVRDYRLLCERHIPAPSLDRAGLHVLWYEFTPNGVPAKFASVNDKPVATLSIPRVQFTTQTVGPFDGHHLTIGDPGIPWNRVRDEFAFESSIVGFSLLLRGADQTGALDHDLVLQLARDARGEAPHPQRDRFIKLVEDARKAVGF